MSISTESTGGESGQTAPAPSAPAPSAPAPSTPAPSTPAADATPASAPADASLLTGTAGDRCIDCNALLAVDQRYCVECGTRRGNPRFALAHPAAVPSVATTSVAQAASTAVTRIQLLLALVIVLIALGLGVLIGQGSSKTPRVIVNGGVSNTTAPKSGAGGAAKSSGSGLSSSSEPFSTGS